MANNRIPCPSCRAIGRDSDGNHLKPYDNGKGGWCYHEKKSIWFDGEAHVLDRQPTTSTRPDLQHLISTYPTLAFPARKISADTCSRYGIKMETDEVKGSVTAVFYPYHDEDGTVTGYKKRTLPKDFSVVGKMKGLFGQKQCKANAKFLIIVEGEQDVLAGWEMLQSRGKNWNIVSVANGANESGTVDNNLLREMAWISSHPSVLLLFDNDSVGKTYAKAVAEVLASQTRVAIGTLPRKDTAKCWEDGCVDEWFTAILNPVIYHPEAIVEGKDIDIDKLMVPKEPGIVLPYSKLQHMTGGLRKGEITLITAASGIGKSTLCKEIVYHLVGNGMTCAHIGLETQMDDVARGFIAMDNNVPVHRLMFNPTCIPREAYVRSAEWMFKSNQMHFFKHWGSINPDVLRAKMLYYAKALGVDFICLDHVSMVIAGNESSDERKDIDRLFEAMTQICVETGVGIIPIIHLKRVQGKKLNHGDEVELTDLRGSAGAEQMSFNVWAMERNQQGDDRDLSRIRVLKNRTLGFTGLADTLRYDHNTGRLQEFTIPEFEHNE